jgi:hypothetical protein
MRVGPKSKWIELRQTPEKDPWYVAMQLLESRNKQVQAVNGATVSQHLWKGKLPAKLSSGQHLIEVATTDMYGREFKGTRIIRVK